MTPYNIDTINYANCFTEREESVVEFDSLIDNDGNFGSNTIYIDKIEESTIDYPDEYSKTYTKLNGNAFNYI